MIVRDLLPRLARAPSRNYHRKEVLLQPLFKVVLTKLGSPDEMRSHFHCYSTSCYDKISLPRAGPRYEVQQKRILGVMAAVVRIPEANVSPSSFASPVARRGPGTILEAFNQLRMTKEDDKDLLFKEYAVNDAERPDIKHDEWHDNAEIPQIDLSRVDTDRAGVAKELNKAATEWGFFQLLNHGLSLETLQEVESQGFKFFELPAEIKAKAGKTGGKRPGKAYTGDGTIEKASSLHWAEGLMFAGTEESIDDTIALVWPEGNAEFRDAVTKFCTAVERINKQLLELLAESLRLKTDFFSQHLNAKRTSALRWNFYPACPRPSDVLGANSHTDGCAITILQQSKVGGLQIQKDGKWVAVKPIEGALVVNIGDAMHAWTNGTFKSVVHRAVVNESVHRLSFAAFLNVDIDLAISAPEELIDESHPRQYRPFNHVEYLMHVMSIRDDPTVSRDGLHVLEGFKLKN